MDYSNFSKEHKEKCAQSGSCDQQSANLKKRAIQKGNPEAFYHIPLETDLDYSF